MKITTSKCLGSFRAWLTNKLSDKLARFFINNMLHPFGANRTYFLFALLLQDLHVELLVVVVDGVFGEVFEVWPPVAAYELASSKIF